MTFFNSNLPENDLLLERIESEKYKFGKALHQARFNQGYTQSYIVEKIDMSLEDLITIESGNINFDCIKLISLVNFLEISSSQIPKAIRGKLNEEIHANTFV